MYSVSKGEGEPAQPILAAAPAGGQGSSPQPDVMQVHLATPARHAAAVVGRPWVHLKHAAAMVGCRVWISAHGGMSSHLVVIVGTCNQCGVLQELVRGRLVEALRASGEQLEDHVEVALLVRAEAAGVVIGKQGFMMQQIRQESGASVQFLREQIRGQRPCVLSPGCCTPRGGCSTW